MTTFLSCVKAAFEMCSELFKNNEMDVQQMMFLSFFLQSKSVTWNLHFLKKVSLGPLWLTKIHFTSKLSPLQEGQLGCENIQSKMYPLELYFGPMIQPTMPCRL